jgi:hypothetical protein
LEQRFFLLGLSMVDRLRRGDVCKTWFRRVGLVSRNGLYDHHDAFYILHYTMNLSYYIISYCIVVYDVIKHTACVTRPLRRLHTHYFIYYIVLYHLILHHLISYHIVSSCIISCYEAHRLSTHSITQTASLRPSRPLSCRDLSCQSLHLFDTGHPCPTSG